MKVLARLLICNLRIGIVRRFNSEEGCMKIKCVLVGFIGLFLVLAAGLVVAEDSKPTDLSRAVLRIESLSCGGCLSTIDSGLSSLDGYLGMGANLSRKLIAVDFAAPLTAVKITKIISETGYPATLETVKNITEKESFAFIDARRSGTQPGGGGCCSGGSASANKDNAKQGSPNLNPPPGGACCPLPGIARSTEKS